MMKTIDRNACKQISADMLEALKAVALKHGVQFSYKSGNFSSSSATFRIEAAVISDGGVTIIALVLGCMIFAAGRIVAQFVWFVFALGYFIHIIGVFAIAFFCVAFFYFLGKECGWWGK